MVKSDRKSGRANYYIWNSEYDFEIEFWLDGKILKAINSKKSDLAPYFSLDGHYPTS